MMKKALLPWLERCFNITDKLASYNLYQFKIRVLHTHKKWLSIRLWHKIVSCNDGDVFWSSSSTIGYCCHGLNRSSILSSIPLPAAVAPSAVLAILCWWGVVTLWVVPPIVVSIVVLPIQSTCIIGCDNILDSHGGIRFGNILCCGTIWWIILSAMSILNCNTCSWILSWSIRCDSSIVVLSVIAMVTDFELF